MAERKGLGHPDTICDAIAEECSGALCRYYLERFGQILHHNVDKVLLRGGSARAVFGGGEVLAPIEVYLAGRATAEVGGVVVPVADLVVEAAQTWFGRHLHALDPSRHLKIHCLIRPGSADLQSLFGRRSAAQVPLANDSVIGAGFAPLTDLEHAVLAVEQHLNSAPVKRDCPEVGEDIKVLGVRHGAGIRLTVACAFIARHLPGLGNYLDRREHARLLAVSAAAGAERQEDPPRSTADVQPRAASTSLSPHVGRSGRRRSAGEPGQRPDPLTVDVVGSLARTPTHPESLSAHRSAHRRCW
jgi:S-adenosylmethionine synthetase